MADDIAALIDLFRYSAGRIVHSVTCDVKTTRELLGHSRLSTAA